MTKGIATGQAQSKPTEDRPGQPGNSYGRWQPGQSGNPGGRAPDLLTPLLRKLIEANDTEEGKAILKELIDIAKSSGMRGQVAALKEIFDRIDGRVPETHKIETDVPITIVYKQVKGGE